MVIGILRESGEFYIQWCWKVEFGILPLIRKTVTGIKDKFEVDGMIQDAMKDQCGKKRSSTDAGTVMKVFPQSPKKSVRQCSWDWYQENQCSSNFVRLKTEALHSKTCPHTKWGWPR